MQTEIKQSTYVGEAGHDKEWLNGTEFSGTLGQPREVYPKLIPKILFRKICSIQFFTKISEWKPPHFSLPRTTATLSLPNLFNLFKHVPKWEISVFVLTYESG